MAWKVKYKEETFQLTVGEEWSVEDSSQEANEKGEKPSIQKFRPYTALDEESTWPITIELQDDPDGDSDSSSADGDSDQAKESKPKYGFPPGIAITTISAEDTSVLEEDDLIYGDFISGTPKEAGSFYVLLKVHDAVTVELQEGEAGTSLNYADTNSEEIAQAKWTWEIAAAPVVAEAAPVHTWEQFTIGQNKKIQEMVAAAAKAQELVAANMQIAKTGAAAAKLFLTAVLNPKVMILNTIADEIDKFVNDFLGKGYYILEVVPDEQLTVPKDKTGNAVGIALSPAILALNYSTALGVGLGTEFKNFTKDFFGKEDPNEVTESKDIPQGQSKPQDKRENDANSDRISEVDGIFGFPKMTPSQVISTMIAAIDDPLDINRPTFSENTEVGALVMIFGFSDMSVNAGEFRKIIQSMVDFFGGDQGLFTEGFKKIGNVFEAALGQHEDPTKHDVTVNLVNVSGVLGTEEDIETLQTYGVEQNYKDHFKVNDFVVGPRIKFPGRRALGYISKAEEADIVADTGVYVNQKVTIRGATEGDYLAWQNFSGGSTLQKAHFYKSRSQWVDQNTSEISTGPYRNDYLLFDEMKDGYVYNDPQGVKLVKEGKNKGTPELDALGKKQPASPKENTFYANSAITKVERIPKAKDSTEFNAFLSPVGAAENMIEVIGTKAEGPRQRDLKDVVVTKDVMGTVKAQDSKGAPPPNFKNATLEDLIGDAKVFFDNLKTFANQLRDLAGDTTKAIKDLEKFIDDALKRLQAIADSINKILKIFSTGLPDAGVYTLIIPPDQVLGVEGLKSALNSAGNAPPNTLDYSVGFLMVADKDSIKLLTDLLAPEK